MVMLWLVFLYLDEHLHFFCGLLKVNPAWSPASVTCRAVTRPFLFMASSPEPWKLPWGCRVLGCWCFQMLVPWFCRWPCTFQWYLDTEDKSARYSSSVLWHFIAFYNSFAWVLVALGMHREFRACLNTSLAKGAMPFVGLEAAEKGNFLYFCFANTNMWSKLSAACAYVENQ